MLRTFPTSFAPRFNLALLTLENHIVISGRSLATRKTYINALWKFIANLNKLPEECTKNEIINFYVKLKYKNKLKYTSLKIHLTAIRYYLKNVAERSDLWTRIPIPNVKDYNIDVLNVDEINLLFRSCTSVRDLLIIQLFYETGIRKTELRNINLSDFDFQNNALTIRDSKHRGTRTVYFGDELKKTIKRYLIEKPSLFSNSKQNLQHHTLINLSSRGIGWMMAKVIERSGIKKRVYPHALRHAFAVHYINFGGTLYQLQKLLGHKKMKTTLHYLQYAVLPESQNFSILDKALKIKTNDVFYPLDGCGK